MGADSTLVNAAFKESESKYAGEAIDMKPLYTDRNGHAKS